MDKKNPSRNRISGNYLLLFFSPSHAYLYLLRFLGCRYIFGIWSFLFISFNQNAQWVEVLSEIRVSFVHLFIKAYLFEQLSPAKQIFFGTFFGQIIIIFSTDAFARRECSLLLPPVKEGRGIIQLRYAPRS